MHELVYESIYRPLFHLATHLNEHTGNTEEEKKEIKKNQELEPCAWCFRASWQPEEKGRCGLLHGDRATEEGKPVPLGRSPSPLALSFKGNVFYSASYRGFEATEFTQACETWLHRVMSPRLVSVGGSLMLH